MKVPAGTVSRLSLLALAAVPEPVEEARLRRPEALLPELSDAEDTPNWAPLLVLTEETPVVPPLPEDLPLPIRAPPAMIGPILELPAGAPQRNIIPGLVDIAYSVTRHVRSVSSEHQLAGGTTPL